MLVAARVLSTVIAHGAMTFPPSRNAADGSLHPWNGSVPSEVPFMFWFVQCPSFQRSRAHSFLSPCFALLLAPTATTTTFRPSVYRSSLSLPIILSSFRQSKCKAVSLTLRLQVRFA